MGLLNHAGASVGNVSDTISIENLKGFFEIVEMVASLRDIYSPHMTPFTDPFDFARLRYLKNMRKAEIISKIDKCFSNSTTIAMKANSYIPINIFENDEDYDIKMICLERNMEDQIRSIERMWGKKSPGAKKFEEWLIKCRKWGKEFREEFKFDYLDIAFEDILDKPVSEAKRMYSFCGLTRIPEDKVILDWVDPKLSRSRA